MEDTLQGAPGDIGLWGRRAPQLLAKLTVRVGRLADAPNHGRDYRHLTNALQWVRMRTTPSRTGSSMDGCLNPKRGADILGPLTTRWPPALYVADCGA
ncbi:MULTISPECIES: hypothetical protein [Bifidobacterium]|uniref:hypothetical protein n=1 Tax=Bifidobacterium TaxID=1678 RepID=UPI0018DD4581|nr:MULTISPECIES: hypothetical protein [Bifidobacterium]MBI0145385.1 hypothetical protein [Bifidobacterium polysaccharolyticum]